jgi:RNA polymerase sigma-70 factor (ECF subfamily)
MPAVRDKREESEIVDSILSGNTDLFHDLVRPYECTVFAMAFALVKNEEDAEDVTQEAFLKALRNLNSWRGEARFSTWLIGIALNEARARLRRENRLAVESIDDAGDENRRVLPELLRDWREVPSEVLERLEVRRLLQEAVGDLPLIYREVFLLRDVQELSISEAAEALCISAASVKVRLHRARMMLQKQLAPQLKRMSPRRRRFLR